MRSKKAYLNLLLAGLSLAGLVLLSGCGAPQGNVENGERWYSLNKCYACHGPNGYDGRAPAIYADKLSFRKFKSVVRNAKSPIMPKYPEEKIPTQDIADMYAWLKTK